ncbi:hypothetical protein C2845_PM09G03940 [Panicum miliaceum]|uniref:Uncharacterized protein n=1 Tax=Panicum miliaceum TaxID=4540 RepID=A0A3L6S1D3_PANMI|nr:hypothetical protein C2845_PM09G03940 [Panicum miliaceum]
MWPARVERQPCEASEERRPREAGEKQRLRDARSGKARRGAMAADLAAARREERQGVLTHGGGGSGELGLQPRRIGRARVAASLGPAAVDPASGDIDRGGSSERGQRRPQARRWRIRRAGAAAAADPGSTSGGILRPGGGGSGLCWH